MPAGSRNFSRLRIMAFVSRGMHSLRPGVEDVHLRSADDALGELRDASRMNSCSQCLRMRVNIIFC